MSNEQTEGLKPCPFCGGEANVEVRHSKVSGVRDRYFPSCLDSDCAAFIVDPYSTWATKREAITAWNTRATPSPSTDMLERREAMPDSPWFLIAIGGKVGDRFRNTIILDCSPDMKELGPEFHWEDTFETDPPEHLPAGAYVWSGFQLGGWAEDDPIVAKGGTFTPHAALTSPRVDEGRDDIRYLATCAKQHADKFPVPAHMAALCDRILATTPADLRVGKMEAALRDVRAWVAALTVTDMNEIVADGGITAGMVVGQEATEQLRRIDRALSGPSA